MRTMKAVIATVALGAVGIATSMADPVYSANVVGFVNQSFLAGKYYIIGNQLNGTNNLLTTVMPTPADGTTLYKWKSDSQSFDDAITYFDGLGWFKAGNPSTDSLAPGEAAFLYADVAQTVTFIGEVPQGDALANPLAANYSFVSSIVPQAGSLVADLSWPTVDGDTIYKWDSAAQSYEDAYTYFDGLGWFQSGNPKEPSVAVGEGFWAFKTVGASWTRAFHVQ